MLGIAEERGDRATRCRGSWESWEQPDGGDRGRTGSCQVPEIVGKPEDRATGRQESREV